MSSEDDVWLPMWRRELNTVPHAILSPYGIHLPMYSSIVIPGEYRSVQVGFAATNTTTIT